jgi:hypothetical protein
MRSTRFSPLSETDIIKVNVIKRRWARKIQWTVAQYMFCESEREFLNVADAQILTAQQSTGAKPWADAPTKSTNPAFPTVNCLDHWFAPHKARR